MKSKNSMYDCDTACKCKFLISISFDQFNTTYRATARDVITQINQCKFSCKFTSTWQARLAYECVPHTRATVTVLPKFLYIWMPFHLVYITAMLVCEELEDSPTK